MLDWHPQLTDWLNFLFRIQNTQVKVGRIKGTTAHRSCESKTLPQKSTQE